MNFCRFKKVFGTPDKGVHSIRFGGVALFDLFLTVLVAYITYWLTDIPITLALVFWIIMGMFMHYLFCVKTSVDEWMALPWR